MLEVWKDSILTFCQLHWTKIQMNFMSWPLKLHMSFCLRLLRPLCSIRGRYLLMSQRKLPSRTWRITFKTLRNKFPHWPTWQQHLAILTTQCHLLKFLSKCHTKRLSSHGDSTWQSQAITCLSVKCTFTTPLLNKEKTQSPFPRKECSWTTAATLATQRWDSLRNRPMGMITWFFRWRISGEEITWCRWRRSARYDW